jgi:hypothetical protein
MYADKVIPYTLVVFLCSFVPPNYKNEIKYLKVVLFISGMIEREKGRRREGVKEGGRGEREKDIYIGEREGERERERDREREIHKHSHYQTPP